MANKDFQLGFDFGLADRVRATLGGQSKARLTHIYEQISSYCETGVMGLSPASSPAYVLFADTPARERTHNAEVVRDTVFSMIADLA